MSNTQSSSKITLEEISERKLQLLKEIRMQKETIGTSAKNLFAPLAPATSKADSIMRSFNTGMAVFDGVVMGIKIMQKIRKYFKHV